MISCMCRYCRYHFVFYIHPPTHQDEAAGHLQHHFRVDEAEWYDVPEPTASQPSKQNPLQSRFRYLCTLCGVAVDLEISLPRLKPTWIQMIMDQNRIKECLRVARQQDPSRYADVTPEKEVAYMTGALSTMNQYLKNILEDDGNAARKRISTRNKTFLVQFGGECDTIFRYLGFGEDHDQDSGESYWLPPRLPPQEGKTPVGSLRSFYEDARSEVQSLLDDKPLANGQPVVKPISARDQLERALGCDKDHRSVSSLSAQDSEAPYFATLGAPVDADDALLKFAYSKQVEADPEQTPTYLEALGTLSARRSEELQMFVISRQEIIAEKRKESTEGASDVGPVERAYAHFGLKRTCPEDPAYFIRVYNTYRKQSPAQKSEHRLALLEIGKDRNSKEIREEVFERQMELGEACQFLHVELEWPMDSIAVTAQSMALVCSARAGPQFRETSSRVLMGYRSRIRTMSNLSSCPSTAFRLCGHRMTPIVPLSRVSWPSCDSATDHSCRRPALTRPVPQALHPRALVKPWTWICLSGLPISGIPATSTAFFSTSTLSTL